MIGWSAPVSPAPEVRLQSAFADPYNNAIATARTCYSQRVVSPEDVARDEATRSQRDRIARSTYQAGHHTILQHATFQFVLDKVSRQVIWSFLHAHPFYNSEQVSQRYVRVQPGHYAVPQMPEAERGIFEETVGLQMAAYRRLIQLLSPLVSEEYYRIFPGRVKRPDRWKSAVGKKAQEIARYVLPVATHAHLYHTVSGLTLMRYRRLAGAFDVPAEQRYLVEAMVREVEKHDPLFFQNAEDAIPLDETPEYRFLAQQERLELGSGEARAFVDGFDASLGGLTSKLVDWKVRAEPTTAEAVRSVLGCRAGELPDAEAIDLVLDPAKNPQLGETLVLTTLGKLTRVLSHAHYTFCKRLSHTADSQDQRHRMVPGSRPVLLTHFVPDRPDFVVPELVQRSPEALEAYERIMDQTWAGMRALLERGIAWEGVQYLLPNAFPIRFEESGELAHLHHKWVSRLCYNAQEEIWRASVEEVRQVCERHPALGRWILPPCGVRKRAGSAPYCPEGDRYCGVPVWNLEPAEYTRIL
jgi:flavin-dependent thymidylate synthase